MWPGELFLTRNTNGEDKSKVVSAATEIVELTVIGSRYGLSSKSK